MPTDPITDLDADALSRAIHARELSCREVMQAYLARIHRLNPAFNAIVNLAADDHLLRQAELLDRQDAGRDHPQDGRRPVLLPQDVDAEAGALAHRVGEVGVARA